MVWEVCPYTNGNEDAVCHQCPEIEINENYGEVQRMCRSLAETACRIVMAFQARENSNPPGNSITNTGSGNSETEIVS